MKRLQEFSTDERFRLFCFQRITCQDCPYYNNSDGYKECLHIALLRIEDILSARGDYNDDGIRIQKPEEAR